MKKLAKIFFMLPYHVRSFAFFGLMVGIIAGFKAMYRSGIDFDTIIYLPLAALFGLTSFFGLALLAWLAWIFLRGVFCYLFFRD